MASGSWSGAQSASGSQTVTPTAVGTDTYTLTCADATGTVSSAATLTVNAASSGHHGGALDITTLLALSGVLLASRQFRRRAAA
jgi:PKD repeat protein